MANLKDLIVNGSARILGNLYATLKGNADTATKLETARTIRTNLGSTSAVGFDGTANITPGIQGTLSVANGGTGQTSIANIQAGKDADGNVISETYAKISDQGNLLPNFDSMTPVQTIEFDTADSNYHVICTRTNTDSSDAEINDVLYFRITVTGTNINQVGNYGVIFPGRINCQPFVIANMLPGTSSSAYGGNRYLGYVFPKALNNGYNWEICILNNRNNSARHYKVEVFKTNSKCTWVSGTATTYNSTYQGRGTMDVETRYGYTFNYMYGGVTNADNATQLSSRLQKFINCTINTAGAALLSGQFVYQNGNSLYPGTDKTKAIEPGFGIQFNAYAYNSGNSVGWDQIRQKQSITSLTNIPHATLARGNPCYFRCTTDSDGNIYSDNYVNVQMTPGYTWYYVGIAQSSSAIALDTTQSFFITLDSNGKLTHINGKQVGGSGGTVDQTYDATSANAQSGVAINGAGFLKNTATGTNALTILGNPSTGTSGLNIGYSSSAGGGSIALGQNANSSGGNSISIGQLSQATGYLSTAIGTSARATDTYAIQIGYGANSEASSLYVSTSNSDNWKMLGSDGKIPSGRLPIATSVSSSSTNDETVGAKLFYDTCGDIEAALHTINSGS